jgi:hypothetical protein
LGFAVDACSSKKASKLMPFAIPRLIEQAPAGRKSPDRSGAGLWGSRGATGPLRAEGDAIKRKIDTRPDQHARLLIPCSSTRGLACSPAARKQVAREARKAANSAAASKLDETDRRRPHSKNLNKEWSTTSIAKMQSK